MSKKFLRPWKQGRCNTYAFGGVLVLSHRAVRVCGVFFVLAGKLDGLSWDGLVVYPLRAWRDGGFWYTVPVQIAVALPKRDDVTVKTFLLLHEPLRCDRVLLVLTRATCMVVPCALRCTAPGMGSVAVSTKVYASCTCRRIHRIRLLAQQRRDMVLQAAVHRFSDERVDRRVMTFMYCLR